VKAVELSIGSLVDIINRSDRVHLPTGHVFRVIAIGLFDVQLLPNEIETSKATSDMILTVPIRDLCGIPLTEERISNLGFVSSGFTYDKGKLSVCMRGGQYENGRTYFNSWAILERQPDYVHQLQTLNFALNGKK